MAAQKDKLVLICTHGPEDPERATIPFAIATAAQASDVDVLIGFQVNGVLLIQQGIAEHVFAPGFPPLKELMDLYIEGGGQLYACGPCVTARHIRVEEFIPTVKVVNAATFVQEFTEANNVIVY